MFSATLEVSLDTELDDVYVMSLLIVCNAAGRIITVDLQEPVLTPF